jgi:subtilisin family serine protease
VKSLAKYISICFLFVIGCAQPQEPVPAVAGVQSQLKEAAEAAGVDQVRARYGLTGRGVRVAVLDTGVDLNHPDLRGAVVEQHCFTRNACAPLRSTEGTSAQDDQGHGTSVAGVIASRGMVSAPGFAPEAEIVAIKVLAADNSGLEPDWVSALEWLYEQQPRLHIDIVNMSIGTVVELNNADCERLESGLSRAIRNLVSAGVTVIASAGNGGSSMGLTSPACNAGAIAVGASYDSNVGPLPAGGRSYAAAEGSGYAKCRDDVTARDQLACFSNRSERLDLVAPGAPIVAPWLGGGTQSGSGTSYAAAAVSGVAALLLQCHPKLSPSMLKDALVSTGMQRKDDISQLSFPVLRALPAVEKVCPGLMRLDAGAPAAGGGGGGAGGSGASEAGAGAAGTGRGPAGAASQDLATAGAQAPLAGRGAPTTREPELDAGEPETSEDRTMTITLPEPRRRQGSLVGPAAQRSSGCSVRARPGYENASAAWVGLLCALLCLRRSRRPLK